MMRVIDGRGRNTEWIRKSLNRPSQLKAIREKEAVVSILKEVRNRGDAALLEYTLRLDKVDLGSPENMIIREEEIREAYALVDPKLIEILKRAAERIRRFHERQRQTPG